MQDSHQNILPQETNLQDIHGGNLWALAKELNTSPENILDLSTNSFAACLELTKNLISKVQDDFMHYPDPLYADLRKSISTYEATNVNEILVGNGANELIYLSLFALKANKILLIAPIFSEYEKICKSFQFEHIIYNLGEENNFYPTSEDLEKISKIECDLAIVCMPNNPTTACYDYSLLNSIRAKNILIDYSYREFIYNTADYERTKYNNLKKEIKDKNIIALHSLTKFFCCPGIRLGYIISSPKLIDNFKSKQATWSVSSLAQKLGQVFIENIELYRENLHNLRKRASIMHSQLLASNIIEEKFIFNGTSFICAKLKQEYDNTKLCNLLAKNKILIRNCNTITGMPKNYIRVQVRAENEVKKFLKLLHDFV